jgi:RNA polymerase sporulation-specific sigma factor
MFGVLLRFIFLFLRVNGNNSFLDPLSAEDERKYFELASKGDEKAREKLILHNMRLVAHIVKKYYSNIKEQDDLISIGTIGLIKGIDSFKGEKGAKFATYAGKCIQNEILMYFRSQKKLNNETSINDSIDVDKDGNPLTYMEILSEDDNIAETIDRSIKLSVMMRAIETVLDEREREIIEKRYGLKTSSEELPQREVAKQLGISRSYVSRIEKTALGKIESYMRKKGYDEE